MRLIGSVVLALLLASQARGEEALFAEQEGARGFLFEVRPKAKDATGKLYLYGTIHAGTKDMSPFTRAVKAALTESKTLALEADPSDLGSAVRLFGQGAMYPSGDSLDRHIPPTTLKDLKAILPRYQLPEERVLKMRLWMVPMLLSVLEVQKAGYDAAYGAEMYLGAWARAHAMPILEIEGMEAQAQMLAGFPEDILREALADGLADLGSGKARKNLTEIIEAWNTSNRALVEREIKEMKSSKRRSEREFGLRMLDQRNEKMADRADRLLREGGTTFFAVGSMHLFGNQGLVALLKKKGYEVTPK